MIVDQPMQAGLTNAYVAIRTGVVLSAGTCVMLAIPGLVRAHVGGGGMIVIALM